MTSDADVMPAADMTVIRASSAAEAARWQEYVERHPEAVNYHRWGWKQVVEESFKWPTYYLMLHQAGTVRGILPLVW